MTDGELCCSDCTSTHDVFHKYTCDAGFSVHAEAAEVASCLQPCAIVKSKKSNAYSQHVQLFYRFAILEVMAALGSGPQDQA